MYGIQHPKADVDRLYLYICKGRRSLKGLEYCVQVEPKCFEREGIKRSMWGKYEEKHLHAKFWKATQKVRGKRLWDWLMKGYLKKGML